VRQADAGTRGSSQRPESVKLQQKAAPETRLIRRPSQRLDKAPNDLRQKPVSKAQAKAPKRSHSILPGTIALPVRRLLASRAEASVSLTR
jgi:hypothetical protein